MIYILYFTVRLPTQLSLVHANHNSRTSYFEHSYHSQIMSGGEAILVLGVISSIISIVDGTKQVYGAATNAQGLPEAFREVAARLPIVQNILDSAKRHIEDGDADEDSCKGAKDVVKSCEKKAKKLDELFQKVIPADSASRAEKYLLAVRTMGKGSRVETLMKGMLVDVQLFAINHGMTTVTDTQRREVAEAIKEVAALPASIPEQAIEGTGFTAIHSGSGSIHQAQGYQYINPGSGQIYHAQSMTFGSNGKN